MRKRRKIGRKREVMTVIPRWNIFCRLLSVCEFLNIDLICLEKKSQNAIRVVVSHYSQEQLDFYLSLENVCERQI